MHVDDGNPGHDAPGPVPELDGYLDLVRRYFDVPMAALLRATGSGARLVAAAGLVVQDVDDSLAAVLFSGDSDIVVIEDAGNDTRCARATLVIGPAAVRFVAGATLPDADGRRAGMLCLFARSPRVLPEASADAFRLAGRLAAPLLQAADRSQALQQRVLDCARELDEARRGVESARRTKSAFISAMSHELRTPLNAVIGYSQMLAADAAERHEPHLHRDLERIYAAGQQLMQHVNDVLEFARIESGRIEALARAFVVRDLIDEIVERKSAALARNGNRMEVVYRTPAGDMVSDDARIRTVLLHLLRNANRFTRQGTVTLTIARATEDGADWLSFEVRDTGVGIDRARLRRLFEPFEGLTPPDRETEAQSEFGLGLAVCRRICHLLGGDIEVDGAAERGAAFRVRLPARLAYAPAGLPVPEASPLPRGDGPLVLIIDDQEDARDLLERQLRRAGYSVVTAAGGEAGVRHARSLLPDLITLDVLMPGMDGWTVLEELKADPATREIPVILATIVDERTRGFTLGASDYLTKPIDLQVLRRVMSRFRRDGSPGRALIVDDDEVTRELLARALRKLDWQIDAAIHGRDGLEQLRERVPAVVLLDLMMPEMDGFEFLREVRATPLWSHLPVIVITSKSLTAAEHTWLNENSARVLGKHGASPQDLVDRLIATLSDVLGHERRSGAVRRRTTTERRQHSERRTRSAPQDGA